MLARAKADDAQLNSMDVKVKIPARGLNTLAEKPNNGLQSSGAKPKYLPKIEWSEDIARP